MTSFAPFTLPRLEPLPQDVVTLDDHERHAQTVLDQNAWAYYSGGAGDEISLQANVQAWRQISLNPRVLRPLAGGHTRIELLGQTLAHPILLAPVAYQRMAHADAEIASAYAAAAMGAGMVLSTQASTALESVAQAFFSDGARGPLWFQLYLQHDRGFTKALVERAEIAGYEALVLTVDAPTHGARDRERRVRFQVPAGMGAVHLEQLPKAPALKLQPSQSALFDGLLQHAPTWDDVSWLQSITRLPIILKGVLHPADAVKAASLGVAGIVVSNHGGRTLDTAPATAHALPRVVQALRQSPATETSRPRMAVLVDGGIRRGTDVLKAMALGADAVLVGRPAVYGLANAGAAGVAHVLRLLRDELEIAMALTGCATLAEVDESVIFQP